MRRQGVCALTGGKIQVTDKTEAEDILLHNKYEGQTGVQGQ